MSLPAAGAVSRAEARGVWTRVALQSFGGPAGQIAVMHRIVVDEKRWLSEERFLHALSYCMLLPGPEAQQLATYIGWLMHGTRGGLVAGGLFILPGFLAILLLSVLYVRFNDLALVAGVFYGLKPAVIVVVLEALLRLRRRALAGPPGLFIAALAFLALYAFAIPFPLVVLAAALSGWALALPAPEPETSDPDPVARPSMAATLRTAGCWLAIWLVPVALLVALAGGDHVLAREAVFFSKVAVVTFGGAYAVLSYVGQQAVGTFHWLAPGEMLDGLGLAETTPGPLIMVVQFVGFLGAFRHAGGLDPWLAAVAGSLVTTWVTFAPCFLFIFVGAPYVEALRRHRALNAALRGVTAAVVGVVLNLAVWFSLHTLFGSLHEVSLGPARLLLPDAGSVDLPSLVIAALAAVALLRFKVGMLRTLGGAAVLGVVLRAL